MTDNNGLGSDTSSEGDSIHDNEDHSPPAQDWGPVDPPPGAPRGDGADDSVHDDTGYSE